MSRETASRCLSTQGTSSIFPHGDPHIMGNGSPVKPVDSAQELQRVLSGGLKVSRHGGGGEITKIICGYMACEPQLSRIFLGGLPPVIKVSIRNDASGQWLENSIRYSVGNADASRSGGEAVLAKLSEVLFIETLRRYIALLPQEQTGWLAGVRDPDSRKSLGPAASQTGPSLDDCRTRERGRNVRVPYWPSVSGVISRRPPLPTSHAGGFSSARKCSHPRAVASRRSRLRLAMSRSRPLTALSNVSSASRRPDSAANRNQLAAQPSASYRHGTDPTPLARLSPVTSICSAQDDMIFTGENPQKIWAAMGEESCAPFYSSPY